MLLLIFQFPIYFAICQMNFFLLAKPLRRSRSWSMMPSYLVKIFSVLFSLLVLLLFLFALYSYFLLCCFSSFCLSPFLFFLLTFLCSTIRIASTWTLLYTSTIWSWHWICNRHKRSSSTRNRSMRSSMEDGGSTLWNRGEVFVFEGCTASRLL